MITLTTSINVGSGQTYTLTDDIKWARSDGQAIVAASGATINLNGHKIIGVGGTNNTSVGVYAGNQSNITVTNGTIQGFSTGVELLDTVAKFTEGYSQTNNRIVNMTLRDCLNYGFQLGGKDCTVDKTTIFNIGLDGIDLSRAIAGEFFGPNATFSKSNVSRLYGGSESVGIAFSGRMQDDSKVIDCVLDGRVASGQSFGIWQSYLDVEIRGSHIRNWDQAIGTLAGNSYGSTRFENNGIILANTGTDLGGNVFISTSISHLAYTAGPDVIIGDAAGRRYKGGEGNDFIAGMGGHDHLYGDAGTDIFAYITPPSIFDKDVIMDLQVLHEDKMGFAREIYGAAADANGNPRLQIAKNVPPGTEPQATGNQATFLYYQDGYTFYYDPDGAGSMAKIPIAYVPYMPLTAANVVFLEPAGDSEPIKRFALSWSAQAVGDFNHDGKADLLWQYTAGNLSEWLMRDGETASPFALPAMPGAEVTGVGDFNGDSVTDLLWRDSANTVAAWFMSEGHVAAGALYGTFKGWELAATGDFNGDGTDDMLWQSSAGKLSEWLMFNGKCYQSISTLPVMKGWTVQTAGDFNGDGNTDLLWQNAAGGNRVWLMDNGQRTATLVLSTMQGWTNVAAGDFNGDGTDDLLWQHDASGALIAWDMKNGKQSEVNYFGQSAGHEFLGVGDVNGDGTDDLFWRHLASTDVKVWLL